MITVEELKEEHLDRFTPRHSDVQAYAGRTWEEIRLNFAKVRNSGPIWAGVDEDGTVVFISGFVLLWEGVAEGWGLFSGKAFRRPKELLRLYRAWIDAVMETWPLWRLQITVDPRLCGGGRWAKAMGFGQEAVLRQWGPDRADYWLYALVR